MRDDELLADRFEAHRARLRAVAYRMLGSLGEADDAVQEAWLRLSRADADEVENLGGWLTTVVARVCLNMLRSRTTRGEVPLEAQIPDPVVEWAGASDTPGAPGADPAQEALLADSVGLALLVVLESLPPAQRLAFVLHDMFAVPFDDIAPIVGGTPTAARQLASRARRRVQGAPAPDADLARQRQVVDAFFAAARHGDFDALVALLDPDVELRTDRGDGAGATLTRGAAAVAGSALMFAVPERVTHPAVVNGVAGAVITVDGRPVAVMAFTVRNGRVVAIDALGDEDRLARLDLG
ncbi:MAG TPA: sigma-70 family RNA polymerase sigma factor [Acidimicrobiales bacterium]|nr:sigma-70 family RNA polymerase sigma factor [Acidimicrobiales bacterium]